MAWPSRTIMQAVFTLMITLVLGFINMLISASTKALRTLTSIELQTWETLSTYSGCCTRIDQKTMRVVRNHLGYTQQLFRTLKPLYEYKERRQSGWSTSNLMTKTPM